MRPTFAGRFKVQLRICPVSKESVRLFLEERRSERGPPPSMEEIRHRVGWQRKEGDFSMHGTAPSRAGQVATGTPGAQPDGRELGLACAAEAMRAGV